MLIKQHLSKLNATRIFIGLSTVYVATLVIELFTYSGFFKAHFAVSSEAFLVVALVFGVLSLIERKKMPEISKNKHKRRLLTMEVLLFGLYLLAGYLDAKYYPNYVFSKYHVQYSSIVPILSFGFILLIWLGVKERYLIKYNKLVIAPIVLGVLYFVSNFNLTLVQINSSLSYVFANPSASYEKKMSTYWGDSVFYVKIIQGIIPEHSILVLPPQEMSWGVTGNSGVVRYFLFPRTLISGSAESLPENPDYNYIVVTPGNELGGSNYNLWPSFKIKAEKVYYIDPVSGSVHTQTKNYDPGDFSDRKIWGLIKIK